jgi:hypothetical protein
MTNVQTHDRPTGSTLDEILNTVPYVSRALAPVASPQPTTPPSPSPSQPGDFTTVLQDLEIAVLGVQTIPIRPKYLTVDGQPWKLSPLKPGTLCPVPPTVAARAAQAEVLGIPFQYWLAEERPEPIRRRRAYDPILLGILPLGDGRGLFCSLGAWDHPARGVR